MNSVRIFGIVILVIGAILLGFGIQATGTTVEKMAHELTGKYTDETMWYIVGGIALITTGGLITLFWKKKF